MFLNACSNNAVPPLCAVQLEPKSCLRYRSTSPSSIAPCCQVRKAHVRQEVDECCAERDIHDTKRKPFGLSAADARAQVQVVAEARFPPQGPNWS